jgi:hypothetical protein
MVQSKNFVSAFGLAAVMILLLLALSVPSSGGAASADTVGAQPSVGASVPDQTNCEQAPPASDVPVFELLEGGSCKANSTPDAHQSLMHVFGRTCRCSCGYPCKTDADCGGGIGSCSKGISCC